MSSCDDRNPCALLMSRTKIMQNIGIVFVKMGQYTDAITSFEHIMSESPNFKTGFNLILCYFALGDRNKMRTAFQKLLMVDLKTDDEDKYLAQGVSLECLFIFGACMYVCLCVSVCSHAKHCWCFFIV